ncbi:histidine triad (HIT) protein [Polynucleobacter sp. QLW-P1DATA-2]|jgi:diadenosine tetraphosphate (Ap4A) HIT family hydrolase|uniref:HIT family protein n=1 Tax=unclassified Polynucleobacter TaxID=2640945 RepID=UPI0008F934BF|nr:MULTISPECIES: HIT family protein [unclassified Polynucleobacter]OIN01029.1 histidine triad (HIT) protein [Polynucleobacter sp. QLW-P1DATA-2]OIN02592.1 histidine triad (HIT) protein [Polynucleobacter sp. MWH-Tro8-2-5-gr]
MANCTLCSENHKPEEGELIWRGDYCRVILVNDPDLPGFCRVIWNAHIAEMSDLTYGERDHIMSLVFAVEETVREVMNPDKLNLAALGNMVPHIHWHVIPRFQDDAFFPGSAWSARTQETPKSSLEARRALAKELPAAIRSAISQMH